MLKRAIVSLSLLAAAAGCDGGGTSVSGPAHDAMCAMNPLAVSCNTSSSAAAEEEAKQGSVFGPPNFASDWTALWGLYSCVPGNFFSMGGRTRTYNAGGGFGDWYTSYEDTNVGIAWGFTEKLTVAPRMKLTEAMDGPYHVLYNAGPLPYTSGVCVKSTDPFNPGCTPAAIPVYGTWIYAPNERPDYPAGVQIITIDPQSPDPTKGACNQRVQFVVPL